MFWYLIDTDKENVFAVFDTTRCEKRKEQLKERVIAEGGWNISDRVLCEFCRGKVCLENRQRGALCTSLRQVSSLSLSLSAFLLSLVLSFWVHRAPLQAVYDAITTVLCSAALSESGKSHQFHSLLFYYYLSLLTVKAWL